MIVLRFKELSVTKIWDMIKDVKDIVKHFPDYTSKEKPERTFLIAIIITLNLDATKEITANARSKKSILMTNDLSSFVKLTPEMRETIRASNPQKSKFPLQMRPLAAKRRCKRTQ